MYPVNWHLVNFHIANHWNQIISWFFFFYQLKIALATSLKTAGNWNREVKNAENEKISSLTVFIHRKTWVQEIVRQIFHNGKISDKQVESRYPFLEKSQLFGRPGDEQQVSLNYRPSPRLIKSDLPYHVIPISKDEDKRSRYLYVARNPKDAAVSFYYFVRSFGPASQFNRTWAGSLQSSFWRERVRMHFWVVLLSVANPEPFSYNSQWEQTSKSSEHMRARREYTWPVLSAGKRKLW